MVEGQCGHAGDRPVRDLPARRVHRLPPDAARVTVRLPDRAGLAQRAPAGLPRPARRPPGDPVTALLGPALLLPNWTADFVTPPPAGEDDADIASELAAVRRTSPAAAL